MVAWHVACSSTTGLSLLLSSQRPLSFPLAIRSPKPLRCLSSSNLRGDTQQSISLLPQPHCQAATQRHSGGTDMASSMHGDRPEGPSNADLSWIKSSLSYCNSNCVEVASLPDGGVGVRDSKDPSGRCSGSPRASGVRFWAARATGNSTALAGNVQIGQALPRPACASHLSKVPTGKSPSAASGGAFRVRPDFHVHRRSVSSPSPGSREAYGVRAGGCCVFKISSA